MAHKSGEAQGPLQMFASPHGRGLLVLQGPATQPPPVRWSQTLHSSDYPATAYLPRKRSRTSGYQGRLTPSRLISLLGGSLYSLDHSLGYSITSNCSLNLVLDSQVLKVPNLFWNQNGGKPLYFLNIEISVITFPDLKNLEAKTDDL
jgi:hypothetical protein